MGKEHMLCDSPFRILKFTFMLLCKSKVVLEGFGGCWIWAQNIVQIWLYNVMEMAYVALKKGHRVRKARGKTSGNSIPPYYYIAILGLHCSNLDHPFL